MNHRKELLAIYDVLLAHFGHRGWWPGASGPFQVVIGAILTRNVACRNAKNADHYHIKVTSPAVGLS